MGFDQHPDLNSAGSPLSQHIWIPNWQKAPGSMSAPWVWFQRLQFSLPVYNPRKQTDIIINLWAKLQLWYNVNFYNAVCFVLQILECCEVWGLVVQTSSRNLNSKIGFLSVYCVSLQTLTAAVADTQSSVQIGQRSVLLCLWSLNKTI